MKINACVQNCFKKHNELLKLTEGALSEKISLVADALTSCFRNKNKVLSCGNGGSACDAEHFACEMVNRFLINRDGLPAISLSASVAALTAIANDCVYDEVFAKQIQALGNSGDFLLAISTSGNSKNVIRAVEEAHTKKLRVIAMTGNDGGKLRQILNRDDFLLCVPSNETPRIQEMHVLLIHIICEIIEQQLFGK